MYRAENEEKQDGHQRDDECILDEAVRTLTTGGDEAAR